MSLKPIYRNATKKDIGKPCVQCGHAITYVKRLGFRCMCDNAKRYN